MGSPFSYSSYSLPNIQIALRQERFPVGCLYMLKYEVKVRAVKYELISGIVPPVRIFSEDIKIRFFNSKPVCFNFILLGGIGIPPVATVLEPQEQWRLCASIFGIQTLRNN